MKKLLIILGILVAVNCVSAQRLPSTQQSRQKMEAYKERLNLTDSQVEALKGLRLKHQHEIKNIRTVEATSKSERMRLAADLVEKREITVAAILEQDQLSEWNKIHEEIKIERQVIRSQRRARLRRN